MYRIFYSSIDNHIAFHFIILQLTYLTITPTSKLLFLMWKKCIRGTHALLALDWIWKKFESNRNETFIRNLFWHFIFFSLKLILSFRELAWKYEIKAEYHWNSCDSQCSSRFYRCFLTWNEVRVYHVYKKRNPRNSVPYNSAKLKKFSYWSQLPGIRLWLCLSILCILISYSLAFMARLEQAANACRDLDDE